MVALEIRQFDGKWLRFGTFRNRWAAEVFACGHAGIRRQPAGNVRYVRITKEG